MTQKFFFLNGLNKLIYWLKEKATFIQFDIIDFYSSISKDLLLILLKNMQEFRMMNSKLYWQLENHYRPIITQRGLKVTMIISMSLQVHLTPLKSLTQQSRYLHFKYLQLGLYRDDGLIFIPFRNGTLYYNLQNNNIRASNSLSLELTFLPTLK